MWWAGTSHPIRDGFHVALRPLLPLTVLAPTFLSLSLIHVPSSPRDFECPSDSRRPH